MTRPGKKFSVRFRKMRSRIQRALWQNPEYRAHQIAVRHTEEFRAKERAGHLGRKTSPALRAKLSRAHKGRPWTHKRRAAWVKQSKTPEYQVFIARLAQSNKKMSDEERFWTKVRKTEHCWIWTGTRFGDGYGFFKAHRKGHRAHRYAWVLYHGGAPLPPRLQVCHNCAPLPDNPLCVRREHLWSGTNAENMRDAVMKGQLPRGEAWHKVHLR